MKPPTDRPPLQTFLVEHYRPGVGADELEQLAGRAAAAVRDLELRGRPLHFVRAVVVPGDESLLSLVEASSERLVREAYTRSGIPFERISPSRVLTGSERESR
jgi:hypothetical protein